MKCHKTILSTTLFTLLLAGTAQAAQDYNSSRSNRSAGVDAPDEADTLLREASNDASSIARSMIASDMKDGYDGDYEITVEIAVSITRGGDRPPLIRNVMKR